MTAKPRRPTAARPYPRGAGVRGVYALANGRHLISEAGGGSATRGLGTLDANGVANNNFELTLGFVNGGWISAAVVPEPATWALWGCGWVVAVVGRRRR